MSKDSFSCEDQNSKFRATLPAPRFPQDGVSTHATSTNFHTVDFDGSNEDTTGVLMVKYKYENKVSKLGIR